MGRREFSIGVLAFLAIMSYMTLLYYVPSGAQTDGDLTITPIDDTTLIGEPGGPTRIGDGSLARPSPAIDQEIDQEAESGDVSMEVEISNVGDVINLCVAALQQSNTGNVQSAQRVNQTGRSEAEDASLSGGSITLSPEVAQVCKQKIDEATAAS